MQCHVRGDALAAPASTPTLLVVSAHDMAVMVFWYSKHIQLPILLDIICGKSSSIAIGREVLHLLHQHVEVGLQRAERIQPAIS
jgi:hypothetical protein